MKLDKPLDTAEEASSVAALVGKSPFILVTSAYHMPRSVGLFRKAGFDVEPYPVDWHLGGREDLLSFLMFSVEGLGTVDLGFHEWIGLAAYWIAGKTSEFFPGPDGRGR